MSNYFQKITFTINKKNCDSILLQDDTGHYEAGFFFHLFFRIYIYYLTE
jgi:hypothetical protein